MKSYDIDAFNSEFYGEALSADNIKAIALIDATNFGESIPDYLTEFGNYHQHYIFNNGKDKDGRFIFNTDHEIRYFDKIVIYDNNYEVVSQFKCKYYYTLNRTELYIFIKESQEITAQLDFNAWEVDWRTHSSTPLFSEHATLLDYSDTLYNVISKYKQSSNSKLLVEPIDDLEDISHKTNIKSIYQGSLFNLLYKDEQQDKYGNPINNNYYFMDRALRLFSNISPNSSENIFGTKDSSFIISVEEYNKCIKYANYFFTNNSQGIIVPVDGKGIVLYIYAYDTKEWSVDLIYYARISFDELKIKPDYFEFDNNETKRKIISFGNKLNIEISDEVQTDNEHSYLANSFYSRSISNLYKFSNCLNDDFESLPEVSTTSIPYFMDDFEEIPIRKFNATTINSMPNQITSFDSGIMYDYISNSDNVPIDYYSNKKYLNYTFDTLQRIIDYCDGTNANKIKSAPLMDYILNKMDNSFDSNNILAGAYIAETKVVDFVTYARLTREEHYLFENIILADYRDKGGLDKDYQVECDKFITIVDNYIDTIAEYDTWKYKDTSITLRDKLLKYSSMYYIINKLDIILNQYIYDCLVELNIFKELYDEISAYDDKDSKYYYVDINNDYKYYADYIYDNVIPNSNYYKTQLSKSGLLVSIDYNNAEYNIPSNDYLDIVNKYLNSTNSTLAEYAADISNYYTLNGSFTDTFNIKIFNKIGNFDYNTKLISKDLADTVKNLNNTNLCGTYNESKYYKTLISGYFGITDNISEDWYKDYTIKSGKQYNDSLYALLTQQDNIRFKDNFEAKDNLGFDEYIDALVLSERIYIEDLDDTIDIYEMYNKVTYNMPTDGNAKPPKFYSCIYDDTGKEYINFEYIDEKDSIDNLYDVHIISPTNVTYVEVITTNDDKKVWGTSYNFYINNDSIAIKKSDNYQFWEIAFNKQNDKYAYLNSLTKYLPEDSADLRRLISKDDTISGKVVTKNMYVCSNIDSQNALIRSDIDENSFAKIYSVNEIRNLIANLSNENDDYSSKFSKIIFKSCDNGYKEAVIDEDIISYDSWKYDIIDGKAVKCYGNAHIEHTIPANVNKDGKINVMLTNAIKIKYVGMDYYYAPLNYTLKNGVYYYVLNNTGNEFKLTELVSDTIMTQESYVKSMLGFANELINNFGSDIQFKICDEGILLIDQKSYEDVDIIYYYKCYFVNNSKTRQNFFKYTLPKKNISSYSVDESNGMLYLYYTIGGITKMKSINMDTNEEITYSEENAFIDKYDAGRIYFPDLKLVVGA